MRLLALSLLLLLACVDSSRCCIHTHKAFEPPISVLVNGVIIPVDDGRQVDRCDKWAPIDAGTCLP